MCNFVLILFIFNTMKLYFWPFKCLKIFIISWEGEDGKFGEINEELVTHTIYLDKVKIKTKEWNTNKEEVQNPPKHSLSLKFYHASSSSWPLFVRLVKMCSTAWRRGPSCSEEREREHFRKFNIKYSCAVCVEQWELSECVRYWKIKK